MTSFLAFVATLFSAIYYVQASGGTPVTQVFSGGNSIAIPTGTNFSPATSFVTTAYNATEATAETLLLQGTITDLRVKTSANLGENVTFTIRNDGGDSLLSCTVASGTDSCGPDTDDVAISVDGERVAMEVTASVDGDPATASWAFTWIGTNSNESMIVTVANMDGGSTTECTDLAGVWGNSVGCSLLNRLSPPASSDYTITKMLARNASDLSTTCQRIDLYKNQIDESAQFRVDLTGVPTTVTDTGSLAYEDATPDKIHLQIDPGTSCGGAGAGTNGRVAVTLGVTNNSQHFQTSICGNVTTSTSVNNFCEPSGNCAGWVATEVSKDIITNGFTHIGFAANGNADPDNGAGTQSMDYNLSDDTSPTIGCQILETALSCVATPGSVVVAPGSLISMRSVPAGTPDASTQWCLSWSGRN